MNSLAPIPIQVKIGISRATICSYSHAARICSVKNGSYNRYFRISRAIIIIIISCTRNHGMLYALLVALQQRGKKMAMKKFM